MASVPPFIHVFFVILILSLYSDFGSCYNEDATTNAVKPQDNLPDEIAKTITVDQSGQGDFNGVQQAIDSILPNNDQWIRIHVNAGVYNEKVVIPKEKPFILLDGEGSSTTVIQFNDFGNPITGSTFQLRAENFVAKGIMFKNTYNLVIPRGSNGNKIFPAPATLIAADMVKFYECGFISVRDTLADATGRHYFKSCYIEGAIDFIWGGGQSTYQDCTINATTGVLDGISGYITAQSRTSTDDNSGYVFDSCNVVGTGPVYLGRAYRQYSRVVFYKSYMYDSIVPEGWSSWSYAGQE
ncbi:hypothetical protein Ddye_028153 [Dipteronia dyeriana]|uniref:pectinesterase n=1 Tax=Dipteronia dyeriana TaxID=168575 RepID=A0AAD9TRC4_9ROSI|nr:hypothetical protein Ddye_028153 [Dipteronia dyeriana]